MLLLASATQHARFCCLRAICVGPCSGKAWYLGVYPRATGFSPPHTPSSSGKKLHCLKLDSSEHEMCSLLEVAREYVGQQYGEIRSFRDHVAWAIVYCFTRAYFSKGEVKNKKNWETKLIFGCCDRQKFLKKKKKSPDLPYLVLIRTYVARNM
jgi:hypothetical protein